MYVVVTCMYRRVWSLGSMYNVHRAKANAKNKLPYIHISIHVNLQFTNVSNSLHSVNGCMTIVKECYIESCAC